MRVNKTDRNILTVPVKKRCDAQKRRRMPYSSVILHERVSETVLRGWLEQETTGEGIDRKVYIGNRRSRRVNWSNTSLRLGVNGQPVNVSQPKKIKSPSTPASRRTRSNVVSSPSAVVEISCRKRADQGG